MSAEVKACAKCGTTKPLGDFHRDASTRDGRTHACKACRCRQNAERTAGQSPEKRAAESARRRRHRLAKPEMQAATREAHRKANAEKLAEQYRRYYEANLERIRHKLRADRHRRRALLASARVEPVRPSELWTGKCGLCGLPLDRRIAGRAPLSPSLDHIVPLARGGAHVQGNLQWTHLICNLRKGARLIRALSPPPGTILEREIGNARKQART